MDNKETKIEIELSSEVAEGIYSNLAVVSHSSSEFLVDFIKMMPGVPKARVKSRVILTPQHAKRLMRALQDNLQKFESKYGRITEYEAQSPTFDIVTPAGEA